MYAPCVPVAWKSRGFREGFPWWAFRPWFDDGAGVLLPPGRHCVLAPFGAVGQVVSRSIICQISLYIFIYILLRVRVTVYIYLCCFATTTSTLSFTTFVRGFLVVC